MSLASNTQADYVHNLHKILLLSRTTPIFSQPQQHLDRSFSTSQLCTILQQLSFLTFNQITMDSSLATMQTHTLLYAIPAEIIGAIANQLVSTDIHGAWRLRGISKAFKVAIEDDIILHQPKNVLEQGGRIANELMPRYLFCRIHKHLHEHHALSARLKLKSEYLCRELNITDSSEQTNNLRALCGEQVKILDTRKVKDLLGPTTALCEIVSPFSMLRT
jgi:hypothetical protein